MKTGIVHSSHGDITINLDTGDVISHNNNGNYTDVVRFDLQEYFQHYSGEEQNQVNEFDILDLGYWFRDDKLALVYEAPDHQWRQEILEQS